jgi:hypothetical protein
LVTRAVDELSHPDLAVFPHTCGESSPGSCRRNLRNKGRFSGSEVEIARFLCLHSSMPLPDQLRTIKNFVRNVFAHETLDEAPVPGAPAEPGRQFAAMLLGREPLALDPEAPARTSAGVLGKLLAPEVLPEDPVEPPRAARPGVLSFLFARETLAEDPPAPPRSSSRPGLLHALFAPEPLPEVAAPRPRPSRSAWLRWLFRFERLDPP